MAEARLRQPDGLFELSTAASYRAGDVVHVRATALVDSSRTAEIALIYQDQGLGRNAHTPHREAIRGFSTGDVHELDFAIPSDALPTFVGRHGRLGWAIRASIKGWVGPEDIAPFDVASGVVPAEPVAVELKPGPDNIGLFGRGKRSKNWDVTTRVPCHAVRRGDAVEVRTSVGQPSTGRLIEVSIECWEHWNTVDSTGTDDSSGRSGTNGDELVHEQRATFDGSIGDEQSIRLTVPTDAPFSYARPDEQARTMDARHSGFTWRVVAREGDPGKGPEREGSISVSP